MNLSLILVIVFFVSALIVIRLWLNALEKKTTLSSDLVDWLKTSTTSVDQKLSKNLEIFASFLKSEGV